MKLRIDNQEVEVEEGSTLLDACRKLEITVPTMCFMEGCKIFTSCMICVVEDSSSGKLLPACSALAKEGMTIQTASHRVLEARKDTAELLLSEHLGDCEAPCQRVCPAHINIPLMIRHIKNGDLKAAADTAITTSVSQDPCTDCSGQCEKACRRGQHDESVNIRMLVKAALAAGKPGEARSREYVKRFNCSIGRLKEGEMAEFMKDADDSPRQEEPEKEAARCLHCDCRKAESCRLRIYSDEYDARQRRYSVKDRKRYLLIRQHADVLYEPGKCIKCGLCVRITEKSGEELGLTFIGRGFDAQVAVPFDESLEAALAKTAVECVNACPTAALAMRDEKIGMRDDT